MIGPLFTFNTDAALTAAFIIGILFGYVLESAGFSSSRKLAGVFYGYDFAVLRVFFTAALTAMLGLAFFGYFGWLDLDNIFINSFYVGPAIIGGVLLGLGFLIGGFCPGTSVSAASIGKIDAWFFIGGILLGAFFFDLAYPLYQDFFVSGAKGKALIYDDLGISKGWFMLLFVLAGIAIFALTAKIQRRLAQSDKKY